MSNSSPNSFSKVRFKISLESSGETDHFFPFAVRPRQIPSWPACGPLTITMRHPLKSLAVFFIDSRGSLGHLDKIHPTPIRKGNVAGVRTVVELHRHALAVHGDHGRHYALVTMSPVVVNNPAVLFDLV